MNKKPYTNPYLAGFALGIVLLGTFLVMGRGLGATGGFASVSAVSTQLLFPEMASQNPVLSSHLESGGGTGLMDWLVFELIGVLIGAYLSGRLAGRNKIEVIKGRNASIRTRLIFALSGGILMGIAAKIARGCTSGQALSGGAMLSTGAWVFMLCIFAGGYLAAWFVRKEWT